MKLTDQSPMFFGKYKGQLLSKVPPQYLLWLCDEIKKTLPRGRRQHQHDLVAYVDDNRRALELEVAENGEDDEEDPDDRGTGKTGTTWSGPPDRLF